MICSISFEHCSESELVDALFFVIVADFVENGFISIFYKPQMLNPKKNFLKSRKFANNFNITEKSS